MNSGDLELLRDIFQDVRQHVGVGVVTQIEINEDASILRVLVKLLPEEREVVAIMSFADVYDVTFPEVDDLLVVAFVDGEPDGAHVVARFSSSDEPIPVLARTGDSVKYARAGKKMYVGSDTKIGIARPDKDPSQPLVLGTVMKSFMTDFIDAILNASQVGQSVTGPVFLDPALRAALVALKSTYVSTAATNFVSQIAFTERGTE